jgi:hypothetical protein
MGNRIAVASMIALFALGGCHSASDVGSLRPARHGRYAGIGVFDVGPLWSKMAVPKPAAGQQAATTADDEHVIVVVDTDTGEVRECGDLSGTCAAFNPWTSVIAPPQRAPVPLTAHAADLAANSTDAEPANNAEAEPAKR